jgi:hypothetical protein
MVFPHCEEIPLKIRTMGQNLKKPVRSITSESNTRDTWIKLNFSETKIWPTYLSIKFYTVQLISMWTDRCFKVRHN